MLRSPHRMFAVATVGVALSLGCAAEAMGASPTQWDFLIEATNGVDAQWTSPTSVDTTFPQYEVAYEIERVVVGLDTFLGTLPLDVTGEFDQDDLTGSDLYGSLPVILYSGALNEEGNQADIALGINASGQGYASIIDPIFGEFAGQDVESLLIEGTITVTPLPEPASVGLLAAGALLMVRRRMR